MITSLLIGAGCFWKTEAAYRFLHGVQKTEVGYIALAPEPMVEEGQAVLLPIPLQSGVDQASPLWKIEVLAIQVDLAILPLDRLLAVFWNIHTASEQWSPQDVDLLAYRSVLVVPDREVHAQVAALIEAHGRDTPIKTRLYDRAAYHPAPESDQDFFVHHPEDPYCKSQVWPSLRTLWKIMPDQLDLDEPNEETVT